MRGVGASTLGTLWGPRHGLLEHHTQWSPGERLAGELQTAGRLPMVAGLLEVTSTKPTHISKGMLGTRRCHPQLRPQG